MKAPPKHSLATSSFLSQTSYTVMCLVIKREAHRGQATMGLRMLHSCAAKGDVNIFCQGGIVLFKIPTSDGKQEIPML